MLLVITQRMWQNHLVLVLQKLQKIKNSNLILIEHMVTNASGGGGTLESLVGIPMKDHSLIFDEEFIAVSLSCCNLQTVFDRDGGEPLYYIDIV